MGTLDEAIRNYAAANAEFEPKHFRALTYKGLTAINCRPAVVIGVEPTHERKTTVQATQGRQAGIGPSS